MGSRSSGVIPGTTWANGTQCRVRGLSGIDRGPLLSCGAGAPVGAYVAVFTGGDADFNQQQLKGRGFGRPTTTTTTAAWG